MSSRAFLAGLMFFLCFAAALSAEEKDDLAARYKPAMEQCAAKAGVVRYATGEGVTAPRLLYQKHPRLSAKAGRKVINGQVILCEVIDVDGTIMDAKVLEPLGYGLDENVEEAAKQDLYEPARKDGKPVRVAFFVTHKFFIF